MAEIAARWCLSQVEGMKGESRLRESIRQADWIPDEDDAAQAPVGGVPCWQDVVYRTSGALCGACVATSVVPRCCAYPDIRS